MDKVVNLELKPLGFIPKSCKEHQKDFFLANSRTKGLSRFRKRSLNYLIVGKEKPLSKGTLRLLRKCEKWNTKN